VPICAASVVYLYVYACAGGDVPLRAVLALSWYGEVRLWCKQIIIMLIAHLSLSVVCVCRRSLAAQLSHHGAAAGGDFIHARGGTAQPPGISFTTAQSGPSCGIFAGPVRPRPSCGIFAGPVQPSPPCGIPPSSVQLRPPCCIASGSVQLRPPCGIFPSPVRPKCPFCISSS